MLNYIEYLNIPARVAVTLVGLLLVLQVIGELLEFKGKIVPEFMKIRKYFARIKKEKEEMAKTLKEVKQLLNDVNNHYSVDNIQKRDGWIKWVNDKAVVYDSSIIEMSQKLGDAILALKDNTKMTEEMFAQSSRDIIIDFATKVSDANTMVSREQFNRIFKVHDKYEKFLDERNLTNGEIDINFQIIKDSYEEHIKNHTFTEDVRGYK